MAAIKTTQPKTYEIARGKMKLSMGLIGEWTKLASKGYARIPSPVYTRAYKAAGAIAQELYLGSRASDQTIKRVALQAARNVFEIAVILAEEDVALGENDED
jgi:hypothetical protein